MATKEFTEIGSCVSKMFEKLETKVQDFEKQYNTKAYRLATELRCGYEENTKLTYWVQYQL